MISPKTHAFTCDNYQRESTKKHGHKQARERAVRQIVTTSFTCKTMSIIMVQFLSWFIDNKLSINILYYIDGKCADVVLMTL